MANIRYSTIIAPASIIFFCSVVYGLQAQNPSPTYLEDDLIHLRTPVTPEELEGEDIEEEEESSSEEPTPVSLQEIIAEINARTDLTLEEKNLLLELLQYYPSEYPPTLLFSVKQNGDVISHPNTPALTLELSSAPFTPQPPSVAVNLPPFTTTSTQPPVTINQIRKRVLTDLKNSSYSYINPFETPGEPIVDLCHLPAASDGMSSNFFTGTGFYRREESLRGFNALMAHISLTGYSDPSNIRAVSQINTTNSIIKDISYAYIGAESTSGGSIESGYQYSATLDNWAPYVAFRKGGQYARLKLSSNDRSDAYTTGLVEMFLRGQNKFEIIFSGVENGRRYTIVSSVALDNGNHIQDGSNTAFRTTVSIAQLQDNPYTESYNCGIVNYQRYLSKTDGQGNYIQQAPWRDELMADIQNYRGSSPQAVRTKLNTVPYSGSVVNSLRAVKSSIVLTNDRP